ncbi:MAG TPA: PHB depolymerase family esterase [Pyrinomonadaceae bacterium]|nr:PHB depolymerase family esterase [Pyrinomonadaceae bacterium]
MTARPGADVSGAAAPGVRKVGEGALLYVPAACEPSKPAPLVLMLHGAGGEARQGISLLRDFADEAGFLLLAPASSASTWDAIRGEFGEDVEAIDGALAEVFSRHRVDPARVAAAGFSDGASYALSLGLTNGDLFTHVFAFSPGFARPGEVRGRPRLFVSHGTRDAVLPVSRCSRPLVRQLKEAGYEVFYREFDGPHVVPPEVAREAVERFNA